MSRERSLRIYEVIEDGGFGKLNAMLKNIMKQTNTEDPHEAIRLVNSGEYVVVWAGRKWYAKDGVIYFSVISDGTTGLEWIARLEGRKYNLSEWAKVLLCSSDFKPTTGVKYELAVLKGELLEDERRITQNIYIEAERRKLSDPNAEVICLIREKFSDEAIKEMGLLWLVAMHKPIEDSDGDRTLFGISRNGIGRRLRTRFGNLDRKWRRDGGFVFAVSQVNT